MAVGLVLISTCVALLSATASLVLGTGWLAAFGVYLATGITTSFIIVLLLILRELVFPCAPSPATAAAHMRARPRRRPRRSGA